MDEKIAPHSITDADDHIPFGVYDGLIPNTNTTAWDKRSDFLSMRRTQRKAWMFFGVYSPEIICVMAIADAGYFANAFCYYYSFTDKVFEEDSVLVPMGFPRSFDASLNTHWRLGNFSIHTDADGKMHFAYNGKFSLRMRTEMISSGASIMAPSAGGRPFNFTYKNVCLPSEARIENNGKVYTSSGYHGAIDYTKGYPPRKTIWNWCSFVGATERGMSIGLNLVKHFNGEIENIVWLDGKKIILGTSYFTLTKPLEKEPWLMGTEDKQLSFQLTPAGSRSADINLLVLRSCFVQAFGKMEGEFLVNGIPEKFIAYGVTEDHLALW